MSRRSAWGKVWAFNATPSRVRITPQGVAEEYSMSPPPFVKNNQTVSIFNNQYNMNEFDAITNKFYGAESSRTIGGFVPLPKPVFSGVIKPPTTIGGVTPLPQPVIGGVVKPPVKPPVGGVGIGTMPPVGGGGGAGSGGGSGAPSGGDDAGTGAEAVKMTFGDDLKSHWAFYGTALLAGGGTGYYFTNKYKPNFKWWGTAGGALAGFGLVWLYFNKVAPAIASRKADAPSSAPASTPATTKPAGGGGQGQIKTE